MKEEYIINNYLTQVHHILENKEDDPLSLRIGCLQQIQYEILKNEYPNIDYINIFCDDINIKFIEHNDSSFKVEKSSFLLNNDLFKIKTLKADKKILCSMENWIKKDIPIILQTTYEMLSPYVWYNENDLGHHNEHNCLIIGIDDEHFYFIDNHYVIEKKRDKTHPQNHTIHMIKKIELEKAVKKYSKFRTLTINPDNLKKINKMDKLLSLIINNYYETMSTYNNSRIYIGKIALKKLINTVSSSQFNLLEKDFFSSHYPVHTIYSRHSIHLQYIYAGIL